MSIAYSSNKSPKKVWKKHAIYKHIPTHKKSRKVPATCQKILFSLPSQELSQKLYCSINIGDCRSPILSDVLKALLKMTYLIPRLSYIQYHELRATKLHLTLNPWKSSFRGQLSQESVLVKTKVWRNRNVETHPHKSDLLSRMRDGNLARWNLSILAKAVPVLRTDEFSFLLHQTVTFISPTCAQKKARRKNFYWHHT